MTQNHENSVLSRVLNEVKAAESNDSMTTSHMSYTSGVFETDKPKASVLSRVLAEVKDAESNDSMTTSHSSYTSGVFESAEAY